MDIIVNGQTISLPKFASVNGELQSEYYQIKSGDDIHMVDFYTVSQVIEFMDVVLNPQMNVYVNNKKADMDTPIYANFDVVWTLEELKLDDYEDGSEYAKLPDGDEDEEYKRPEESASYDSAYADRHETNEKVEGYEEEDEEADEEVSSSLEEPKASPKGVGTLADAGIPHDITVEVNGEEVILSGKAEYVFVDVFEFIDFDLSTPKGSAVVTRLNGKDAQYMEKIDEGDSIDIHWEK